MTQDATRPPQKCHECGATLTNPDEGCQYCGHGRKAPAPKPAAATTPAAAPVEDEGAALARDISSAASTAFDKIKSFVTGQPSATAAAAATTAAAATAATATPAPAPAPAPKPAPAPATTPAAATATTAAAAEKPVRPRPQPKPDAPQRKNVADEGSEEKPARKPLDPARAEKISGLTQELRNHPSASNVINRVRPSEPDEDEDEDDDESDEDTDQLWAILGVVYYVSLADEEHDEDEQEELARIMSELTDEEADEDTLEEWIEEWDEAWEEDDSYDEMLASFAETLETDELKRQAFNLGVGIAVLDGEISDEESEVILYVADALEIPKGEARRTMRKALE